MCIIVSGVKHGQMWPPHCDFVFCMLCRECVKCFLLKTVSLIQLWLQLLHLMSTPRVSKQCVTCIAFYESVLNSGMVNLAGLHLFWAELFLCEVTSYQQLKLNYHYMKIFYAVQLVCCFVLGYDCQNFLCDGEQIIYTLLIHVRIKWRKRCKVEKL